MKTAVRIAGLSLVLLAGSAFAAAPDLVKMPPATQARLGVVTAPLRAAHRGASVSGFARALDAVPLATLDSDIATAVAALAASQAEAARTRALNAADQTVSRQVAEAAAAQARSDAARLTLLRRRLGLEWGPSLAALSDARRGRLVADLAAGRAALVRIDAAGGLAQLRGAASLDLGPGGPAKAAILGPVRIGDPRLQSTGLLALVTGPRALSLGSGSVVPATIAQGAGAEGVILPRGALLRTGGQTYAFVQRGPGDFERRPVTGGLTDPDGLFVASGFRAGEAVVTTGASQLFAAQSAPAKAD